MLAQKEISAEEARQIQELFASHNEWLLSDNFSLRTEEIELSRQNDFLVLSCLTARGWQSWKILEWKKSGEKLLFSVARKLNSHETELEFVPRISTAILREDLNAARLVRAREIAELARKEFSNLSKIEKVGLNQSNRRGQSGTIARILLAKPNGKTVAVCGSILKKTDLENLLSSSILWLTKIQEKRKIAELWLVVEESAAENLQKICALLRAGWREKIKIYERVAEDNFDLRNTEPQTENKESLNLIEAIDFSELWNEKPKKIGRHKPYGLSETAQEILGFAPDKIDIVQSKRGETLRFHGLPFARVRKTLGEEHAWFGLEGKRRQILDETTLGDFEDLLQNLHQHRRGETDVNKRNILYRVSPEAWLESILRRDVSRLDPNLILAPLHAQFRFTNKQGALDLLALRTDGRLVVIELKVAPDRGHIFQAVNYWRQIELQRRAGNIERAGLFEDLKIANVSPLVYLVAPLMSFHRDFDVLARAVSPEIEIWRFDLNENWRSEIRVARRRRIN